MSSYYIQEWGVGWEWCRENIPVFEILNFQLFFVFYTYTKCQNPTILHKQYA